MGLADNLKRLRKKQGWSQTQLAKQIGSHLSHVNRIETGKYNPSLEVVQKLPSVFDVSIDYLISDTTKKILRKCALRLKACWKELN